MANSKKAENEVKRTGLYWPGKRTEVERVALPFQVVETVNVSRATRSMRYTRMSGAAAATISRKPKISIRPRSASICWFQLLPPSQTSHCLGNWLYLGGDP